MNKHFKKRIFWTITMQCLMRFGSLLAPNDILVERSVAIGKCKPFGISSCSVPSPHPSAPGLTWVANLIAGRRAQTSDWWINGWGWDRLEALALKSHLVAGCRLLHHPSPKMLFLLNPGLGLIIYVGHKHILIAWLPSSKCDVCKFLSQGF